MFAPPARRLLGQQLPRLAPLMRAPCGMRRQMSRIRAKDMYAVFPATLHYYSPHRVSSLFDWVEKENRPDDLLDQAVSVAEDGLVYPHVRSSGLEDLSSVSNGAVFMPNTYVMQELARVCFNQYYLDLVGEGKQLEEPQIYTVAKGTPVPKQLVLIHERHERFSLQPFGQGMSLNELNRSLDEFYDEHAVKETAVKWFVKHPLCDAMDGAKKDVWMAQ